MDHLAAAVGVALCLAGCASARETVRGWFKPTSSTEATQAGAGRGVYYAGVEGLEVHSEPSASSSVLTKLSLHEKVVRSKVERGYAYVESATSGAKGWVDNADLIWRLPSAGAPGAPAAEPGAEEPPAEAPAAPAAEEPPVAEEPQTPEAPSAVVTDTETSRPTTTTVPAPKGGSGASPNGVSPSILDSY